MRPTSDGGVLAVGSSLSFQADQLGDAWVVKLDAAGRVLWQFGGAGGDRIGAVCTMSDGGVAAMGNTDVPGVWVRRLDAGGNTLWQKELTGTQLGAWGIDATQDGGVVIAGYRWNIGAFWAWAARFDASGALVWQNEIGVGGGGRQPLRRVQPVPQRGPGAPGW